MDFKRIFRMLRFVILKKILEYRYMANFAFEHRGA